MPSSVAETSFPQSIWSLCVGGRFNEAQQLLLGRLSTRPHDVEAWILLAKVHQQRGDSGQALAAASRAAALDPGHAEAHYTLGRVQRAGGRSDAAEQSYRRALALAPDNPDALTSLGMLLRARGATLEAVACYRRALAVKPDHPEAANNLGNALTALGATAEAGALHERGRPPLATRMADLCAAANALLAGGNLQDALPVLLEALRIAPYDAAVLLAVGKLEILLGHHQIGLDYVEKSAQLDAGYVEAQEIARQVCVAGGLYPRARRYSEHLLKISPTPDIALGMHLLLPCIQSSHASISATRQRYRAGLDDELALDTVLLGPNSLIDESGFFIASHPSFYLAYHGENDRELQIDLARVYLKRMPGLAMTANHCRRAERRPGRIRIGFISRFLRKHSIGATARGLIDQLARERFEVFALRITPCGDDATTQAIRASADHTVDLHPELTRAREQIAALELDILFFQDIGMEQSSYFLAFARLARVQCVSFGHPQTTGIPNVDYFVSNDLYESAEAQDHYSERLFLLRDLPTLAYYYKPRAGAGQPARARLGLGLADDATVYLCPQTLFKLHPDFDQMLKGILTCDPAGVVILIDYLFDENGAALRERFGRAFPESVHRIKFVPQMDYDAFLDLLAMANVILDTPHFNGMNTSLEAFAAGTPVVTLPGRMQRGRHTQAMYRKMGLLDCIAADAANYIDIAVRIGTDRAYAQALRTRILARNGALFEDRRVVEEFERFFTEALAGAPVPTPPAQP